MCHLKFNNHKGDFLRLLRSAFPQWELAKKRLERIQEF
ncbi:MAG: M48 family metallopeptidase [Candidatus Handelsmanbacteria bacterium]|nr:M48 family metallopeptidase [Candidatus Handelsmanbacteria bacterium]